MPVFNKPFEVVLDASDMAIGVVLLQDKHPIAFESKKLSKAELNYTVIEKELLGVMHALWVWGCYLEGSDMVLVTDHCPNSCLDSQQTLGRKQARWSEFLHQFCYTWEYRPGPLNVADPISRFPCDSAVTTPSGERDGALTVHAVGRPSAHPRSTTPLT